jgi:hypothetical protein
MSCSEHDRRSRLVETQGVIVALALLVVAVVAGLYIPAFLTRRAVIQVVRIFCRHNALTAGNAKTATELGLGTRGMLERIGRPRDYKPHALRVLQQMGAVHVTEDGRLYMNEENLHESLRCEKLM